MLQSTSLLIKTSAYGYPALLGMGRKEAFLLWGKGKEVPLPITIAITFVKDSTKTIANSSDFPVVGGDVK